jgi:hypothetical protein
MRSGRAEVPTSTERAQPTRRYRGAVITWHRVVRAETGDDPVLSPRTTSTERATPLLGTASPARSSW